MNRGHFLRGLDVGRANLLLRFFHGHPPPRAKFVLARQRITLQVIATDHAVRGQANYCPGRHRRPSSWDPSGIHGDANKRDCPNARSSPFEHHIRRPRPVSCGIGCNRVNSGDVRVNGKSWPHSLPEVLSQCFPDRWLGSCA